MSDSLKRLANLMVVLLVLSFVTPHLVSIGYASSTNAVGNPSFESSTHWQARYSTFLGGYAKVQDSSTKHSGSYSGLTRTIYPKQEYCSGSLYQDFPDVPVENLSTFYYWIRKGRSAASGYYQGKVCIYLTGGYKLYYFHGFDGSSPPPDGTKYKYINAGNPKKYFWIQISRNLCTDLVDKFGASILDRSISKIELYSFGSKNLRTQQRYGQDVNWDDIFIESECVSLNISLTSSTVDGYADVGTITFNDTVYTLPDTAQEYVGSYSVTANSPEGYLFDHWENSGGLFVSNSTSQNTTVTVTDSGTLEAVYTTRLWTFMVYMSGDNNLDYWERIMINDMERIGSTDEVTVLAMLDRDDTDGTPPEPGLKVTQKYYEKHYYITKDDDDETITSPVIWYDTEVNMGDPNTLVDFLNRSIEGYSAQHYALILMDHGHGFKGIIQDCNPQYYWDFAGDWLEMPELKWALNKSKNETGCDINVIGCHACLMAETEVVYQTMDFGEVFVASEELMYTDSWPYHWILGNLTEDPLMDPAELGSQIVTCHKDYAEAYIYNSTEYPYGSTVSAANMTEIDAVAGSISNLGNWLKNNLETYEADIHWTRDNVKEYYDNKSDYVDAYHLAELLSQRISDSTLQNLCQQVRQNIADAVISEWHRSDAEGSHGLSLFFPDKKSDYEDFEDEYDVLDISATYLWDEFLKEYLDM